MVLTPTQAQFGLVQAQPNKVINSQLGGEKSHVEQNKEKLSTCRVFVLHSTETRPVSHCGNHVLLLEIQDLTDQDSSSIYIVGNLS